MRKLIVVALGMLLSANLFGQDGDRVKALIAEGTQLHDAGRYDEAVDKYKAALAIDGSSWEACYEISFTYMVTGKYAEAIVYSKKVVDMDKDGLQGAYIVLGSCLDLTGKSDQAVKVYEKGLKKFPRSSLLSYNLGLTLYNQKEYDRAEALIVQAISNNPKHGSSHLVLSAVMQAKGQRVKSILPLYYFLMLEPNSKRSPSRYATLMAQLGQGVTQKDEKNIDVRIPFNSSKSDAFSPAEMMVSLQAASRYMDENKGKSEAELFVETTRSLFSVLGELKKDNSDFWWDLYVTQLYDLVKTGNVEAFCYYISQSDKTKGSERWIFENPGKMQALTSWMEKR